MCRLEMQRHIHSIRSRSGGSIVIRKSLFEGKGRILLVGQILTVQSKGPVVARTLLGTA